MSQRPLFLLLVLLLLPVLAACELDPFALERDGELRVQVLADELGDESAPANGLTGEVKFDVRVVAEMADGTEVLVTDGTQSGSQAFGATAGTLAVRRFPPSNIANLRVEFHDVSAELTAGARELGLFNIVYFVGIAPNTPVVRDLGPVEIPAGVQRTLRIDFAARSWLAEQEGQVVPAAAFRDRVHFEIR